MASDPSVHHSIDYIEMVAPKLGESRQFFERAFGWKFNEYGPGYVGFEDGAREQTEGGGLAAGDAASTLVVIFSDDLDASLAQVTEAGAQITKQPFDFPGGRRFEFLDPSGNALAVWTKTS